MSKHFPPMHITDMYLNKRYLDTRQRISQRHARMCESAWIHDDEVDVATCLMYAIDKDAFVVRLDVSEVCRLRGALFVCGGDYVGEGCGAVDCGFARAEEVEVWAVY